MLNAFKISPEITADIYRRMESSKRWMNEDSEDDSQRKSPSTLPQAPPEPSTKGTRTVGKRKLPVRVASTAAKSPPSKKKKPSKAPQSLPFITDTNIVDIIVEEEARAQRKSDSSRSHSPNDQNWTLDEVIEFFRGVYCHGAFNYPVTNFLRIVAPYPSRLVCICSKPNCTHELMFI